MQRDKAITSYRQDLVNESIGSGPEAEQSLLSFQPPWLYTVHPSPDMRRVFTDQQTQYVDPMLF